jgi:AAA+ superfamily predicted ATPase
LPCNVFDLPQQTINENKMKIYIRNLQHNIKINVTKIILDTMGLETHKDITDDNVDEALDIAADFARSRFQTDDIDAYAI